MRGDKKKTKFKIYPRAHVARILNRTKTCKTPLSPATGQITGTNSSENTRLIRRVTNPRTKPFSSRWRRTNAFKRRQLGRGYIMVFVVKSDEITWFFSRRTCTPSTGNEIARRYACVNIGKRPCRRRIGRPGGMSIESER